MIEINSQPHIPAQAVPIPALRTAGSGRDEWMRGDDPGSSARADHRGYTPPNATGEEINCNRLKDGARPLKEACCGLIGNKLLGVDKTWISAFLRRPSNARKRH